MRRVREILTISYYILSTYIAELQQRGKRKERGKFVIRKYLYDGVNYLPIYTHYLIP